MRLMSYSECLDYIRSDYYRITGRSNASLLRMWMAGILDVGFRFLFWWRLSKCNNKLAGGVILLMNNINMTRAARRAFLSLGKYSMPMWMTHTYFSVYLFSSIIYGFRYPVLIYIVLLLVSLATAYLIIPLSNRIYRWLNP